MKITNKFYPTDVGICNENTCLEISGGSASLYIDPKSLPKSSTSTCKCQCVNHLKTYREDDGYCVDTIRGMDIAFKMHLKIFFFNSMSHIFYCITECSIIPFVSSNTALDTLEKIPSVFLPLQGQIIYPSKELFFAEGKLK